MLVRSDRFLDLEMPPELLTTWITPVERFFVRNHMFEPTTLDVKTWKLSVAGEVKHAIELTYGELKNFPAALVVNTLECAGNGRAFFHPPVPGAQWRNGAVGTGRYGGVRLKDVLQRAGVKPSAKHVMFRGLDEVPGKVPAFIRSIPLEKALQSDTLVATHLNGSVLPKHHGFPARAVVPGWVGAASCKWLTEIRLLDKPAEGNFMSPGYRIPIHPTSPGEAVNPEQTTSVTALPVKSIFARPLDGARLPRAAVALSGAAWAGESQIVRVEISTDGGKKWEQSRLRPERARYAWRLWSYMWRPQHSGEHVLMARATDSGGRVQPAEPAWNPSGYLYNAWDRVTVHVE
jgi:sulfite oxidase